MGRQAQTGFTARLQPGEGLQNPQAPGPVFPHPRTEAAFKPPSHGLHARNEKSEMKRAKRKERNGKSETERAKRKEQNGLASAGQQGE